MLTSVSTACSLCSGGRSQTDCRRQWAKSSSWDTGVFLQKLDLSSIWMRFRVRLVLQTSIERGLMVAWEHLLSKAIWKINNYVITWHSLVPNMEKTTLVDQEGGLWRKRNLGLIKPKVCLTPCLAFWKESVSNVPEKGVKSLSLKIRHQHA